MQFFCLILQNVNGTFTRSKFTECRIYNYNGLFCGGKTGNENIYICRFPAFVDKMAMFTYSRNLNFLVRQRKRRLQILVDFF